MIKFNNLSDEIPYLTFKSIYEDAFRARQKNIEAICISSYSPKTKEVNARFVNLKFINNREFIFFSNYRSPKSQEFRNHSQINGLIFWSSINIQIRIKAHIRKTKTEFNQSYFATRNRKKNALALSSNQSKPIDSYEVVTQNYKKSLEEEDLSKCPNYWGGFSFIPYYFEFWEGSKNRLNKRKIFELKNKEWVKSYLQP
tara:strand:- start:6905 stop:7501 length:597 start_codon:yes stop_codon:yes gene_type:complete